MKKLLFILFLTVIICTFVMVSYANEVKDSENAEVELENENDMLKNYIQDKIIPVLIGVSTSIIAFLSTLKGVFSALKSLKDTKEGYEDDRNKFKEEMKIELEKVREKYDNVTTALNGVVSIGAEFEKMKNHISTLSKEIANVSEIASLGFSNNENLVKEGIARKITVIAEQNKEQLKDETI